jgi:hypothetical protein
MKHLQILFNLIAPIAHEIALLYPSGHATAIAPAFATAYLLQSGSVLVAAHCFALLIG